MSSHSPSSNFKSMLDAALVEYKEKTGKDLLGHWLADELKTCESVDAVLEILRDQAKTFEQSGDQKLMKWIDPMVHVLYTFSGALGDGVSLAFPPAKVIFTGIGVLLAAAKDARASHGAIINLFERVESFFKRLEVYTQISLTTKMAEVLVKIVVELLSILSIATKEVKRRRAKVFARKLLGRTDIEDALKRLDTLIQEEVQMAIAQILKVTTEVKDGADKANMVMQQDMEEVKRDVLEVKRDVEEVKWTQIEQDINKWFSSPDPSANYNTACETHHEGTAAWFFRGTTFKDWLSSGSLLWIHGKPGSGKSILCSVIIKHVISLHSAGLASLAYFYFDFRDKDKKQDLRNFVTSLLIQLSTYSNLCCKIISRFYSTHGKGTQKPSDSALKDCLREMLSVASPKPTYIIIDALDECPNASGMPTPREAVLDLLEGLVHLDLPNLHICVTSRPEIDIKNVFGPLATAVSLHDEIGQKADISDYVGSVVSSDRMMRRWRSDEKELVIKELSKKADGMFRWVFCQLEVLRHCLPASLRQTLDQLPKSLDETYLRVLSQIPQANQAHAHRMLQCLVVAVRPLRVEELAELLAFEFDATQGGIPKYRAAWRLDDQTQAVLSTCSSLVTIVDNPWNDSQVVQFSHFSVKEFLVSDRLTSPLGDFSRYHIRPGLAHTLLTQACLGFLLHLDDHIDKENAERYPLAEYAARHWVEHAQFEGVASRVKDGIEALFDSDKPHFAVWIEIYDIDRPKYYRPSDSRIFPKLIPNPFYYAALCGLYDLVKHLAIKHPQHVNAWRGQHEFPLFAALRKDHVKVAELLLEHGANVHVQERTGKTILLKIFSWPHGNLAHLVKLLLKHGAGVNARDNTLSSSLHLAEYEGQLEVAQILLQHKAHVNSQDNRGKTPLHMLLERRTRNEDDVLNHVRLLLAHGAEVNKRDKDNQTPLHLSMGCAWFKLARFLLDHGADANAENNNEKTPLHQLPENQIRDESDALDLIGLLLKHGAVVNRRDNNNQTPLLLVMEGAWFKLARLLLDHGADANVQDNNGKTPLHLLSESRIHDEGDALELVWLLLERGAVVNRQDNGNQTPLLLAIGRHWFDLARILLEHGANVNVVDNNNKTPLHILSEPEIYDKSDPGDIIERKRLWLEHGAEVNRRYKDNETSLLPEIGETSTHQVSRDQYGSRERDVGVAQLLPESGVDINVQVEKHIMGPLRSKFGPVQIAQALLDHGANVNAGINEVGTSLYREPEGVYVKTRNHPTPLHMASLYGRFDIARVLLDHGAIANSGDVFGRTPLHLVVVGDHTSFEQDRIRIAQLLLERGVDVNAQDENDVTPLHVASYYGKVAIVRVLLDNGAAANSKNTLGRTPLHSVVRGTYLYSKDDGVHVAQLLLERGADANARGEGNRTPLHLASFFGKVEIARVLLDGGAAANLKGNQGRTPLHVVAEGYSDNDVPVAQLLLERGADVNVLDDDSQTPLHLASYFGRVEMVQVLLNAGANISAKDAKGQTPLHVVSQCPYYSRAVGVIRIFLGHGADVNAQDKNYATPLDLASYHGRTEIASLFLHHGGKANATANATLEESPTPSQPGSEDFQFHYEHCPTSTDSLVPLTEAQQDRDFLSPYDF